MLGDFNVTISTYNDMPFTDEDGVTHPPTKETVPVQYNKNTELTATVAEQGQEVNFELTSEGKVVQGGW